MLLLLCGVDDGRGGRRQLKGTEGINNFKGTEVIKSPPQYRPIDEGEV